MSNSTFCIQQRQQEQQQLKKFLAVSLAGSALLHGVIAIILPRWSPESPTAEEPIELIIVEQPEPDLPEPEPEPEQTEVTPTPAPATTATAPPEIVEPQTSTAPASPAPPEPPVSPQPQPAPPKPVVSPPPQATAPEPEPRPAPPPQAAPPEPVPEPVPTAQSLPIQPSREQKPILTTPNQSAPDSAASPTTPGTVATRPSAPPQPQPSSSGGISCVSHCQPAYPSALEGAEGSATVQIVVDGNGNVASVTLARANSNSQINRQALLAARQMKFSAPAGGGQASVQVNVNFTVAGSEFDRKAREREEQADRERQERQAQLERERQERERQAELQRQLEAQEQQRLEQERQTEIQRQQQQPPAAPVQPSPTPAEAADDEMLRKFRERIERYRNEE